MDDARQRQRECSELLRREAQRSGLLDAGDVASPDGVLSEAASEAIEKLLERELRVPEPDEAACRRHYAAHADRYRLGARVRLRSTLKAVDPVEGNGVRLTFESVIEVEGKDRPAMVAETLGIQYA